MKRIRDIESTFTFKQSPALLFEDVKVQMMECVCKRAKVPGGWIVILYMDKNKTTIGDTIRHDSTNAIFVPDNKHTWI